MRHAWHRWRNDVFALREIARMRNGKIQFRDAQRHLSLMAALGAACCIAIAMMGCASIDLSSSPDPFSGWQYNTRQIPVGGEVKLAKDEVLFFGKIVPIVNGKLVALSTHGVPTLVLARDRAGKVFLADPDGHFYGVIPVGTYDFVKVASTSLWTRALPCVSLALRFKALTGDQVVYIGTLRIDAEVSRRWDGTRELDEINFVEVLDEFETARQELLTRYPDMKDWRISKSLLSRIPGETQYRTCW
jgi:hypothetical protein